jgi:serine/threonine-protein kinase
VKLANLFLASRADGERVIKVLDFGVSKSQDGYEDVSLTRTATLIGSPLYMAPEQIRDPRLVDERADVWSLGIVLYKLLTDEAPFSGQSTNAVCAAIAADPPAPLRSHAAHLPRELETVVARCLEKRPELRYPSVAALAHDLAPFASETGAALARQLMTAALPPGENRADARRSMRPALAAGLVVLVVAGAAGVWLGRTRTSATAASTTPQASTAAAPFVPETGAAAAMPVDSSRSLAPDAPAAPALDRELRRPTHKRAAPSATPRPAPPSSRFGGSALDDHQ